MQQEHARFFWPLLSILLFVTPFPFEDHQFCSAVRPSSRWDRSWQEIAGWGGGRGEEEEEDVGGREDWVSILHLSIGSEKRKLLVSRRATEIVRVRRQLRPAEREREREREKERERRGKLTRARITLPRNVHRVRVHAVRQ